MSDCDGNWPTVLDIKNAIFTLNRLLGDNSQRRSFVDAIVMSARAMDNLVRSALDPTPDIITRAGKLPGIAAFAGVPVYKYDADQNAAEVIRSLFRSGKTNCLVVEDKTSCTNTNAESCGLWMAIRCT